MGWWLEYSILESSENILETTDEKKERKICMHETKVFHGLVQTCTSVTANFRNAVRAKAKLLCCVILCWTSVELEKLFLRGVPEFCGYIPGTVWPQLLQENNECGIFFRLLEQHPPKKQYFALPSPLLLFPSPAALLHSCNSLGPMGRRTCYNIKLAWKYVKLKNEINLVWGTVEENKWLGDCSF